VRKYSRSRVSLKSTSKLAVVVGFMMATGYSASPAAAAPVTYTFVDASATFPGQGTSYYAGTFVWDSVNEDITSANITVTGFDAGTYQYVANSGGFHASGFEFAVSSTGSSNAFDLYFNYFNGVSNDPINNAYYGTENNVPAANIDSSVTGYATPNATPLPATLPLFVGGAGLVGLLLTRRRKRSATAVAV
jgi:hypothetical protein